LHSDRDTVRCSVVSVLCSIANDGCKQETDGDSELVGSDDRTSDPFRGLGVFVSYNSSWKVRGNDKNCDHNEMVRSTSTRTCLALIQRNGGRYLSNKLRSELCSVEAPPESTVPCQHHSQQRIFQRQKVESESQLSARSRRG